VCAVCAFGEAWAQDAERVIPPGAVASAAYDGEDPRVETELVFDAGEVAPGATVGVGVWFRIDDEWHTYWRNSGEAGMSTEVTFSTEVEGVTFGEVAWPAPSVFEMGGGAVTTYGYADEVLHHATMTVPEGASGEVVVTAVADYLTCKIECIPGRVELTRAIRVGPPAPAHPEIKGAFVRAAAQRPRPAAELGLEPVVRTSTSALRQGDTVRASVEVVACAEGECPRFELDAQPAEYAFVPDLAEGVVWKTLEVRAHPSAPGAVALLEGRVSHDALPERTRLAGVLKLTRDGAPLPIWIEAELPTAQEGEAVEAVTHPTLQAAGASGTEGAPSAPDASVAPDPAGGPEELSLLYVLLLAFVGGVILNVMPCVFPVLTLKVASLAEVAGKGRAKMLGSGLAYTAGIVSAMWALAAVVVALRVAGTQAGWGFQFQNPYFLVGLCVVLVGFALNLFGAYEFNVPLGGSLGGMDLKEDGLGRSFGEGLLCVVLATPCSAPFMGTAVGFALASSAPTIVAVFTLLGLGLASPYLLLTAAPGWSQWMPRPGGWLVVLKQLLGFSLVGTAVWLLWLVGQSFGVDGMTRVLVVLVAASLGLWAYGTQQYQSGRRRLGALAVGALLVGGAGVWALPLEPAVAGEVAAEVSGAQGEPGYTWEPFDEARIEAEVAAGRVVFVDFTADWCITCKVNERGALASQEVIDAVRAHDAVMLKADWTRRDDRIRSILARYGKAGVPMYLVYGPGRAGGPEVLPEVLTAERVVSSLASAAKAP
jgi:thiol:disulfide interchange protein DsbD